jgi:uncharacterized protein YndB with AHSA1/START domain
MAAYSETKEHDMADIRHRVGIAAPQERVYQALATTEGLSGWWMRDVRGDAGVGGKLEFYTRGPEPVAVMEVTDLVPDQRVGWRCVGGPEEWVGTNLAFELDTTDGQTALRFIHGDWRDPVDFMHHCSTKWAYFLLGLKAGLEGGAATPYPDDLKISSWG